MIDEITKLITELHTRRHYVDGYAKSGIRKKVLIQELEKRCHSKQADKVRICGTRINEFINMEHGHNSKFTIYRCGLRSCPDCAQRKSHGAFVLYYSFFKSFLRSDEYAIFREKGYRFSTMVFTVKKAPSMRESLSDLKTAFNRWWQNVFKGIEGVFAIAVIEVTIDKHVHMHVLLFSPYRKLRKQMIYQCLDCDVTDVTGYNDLFNFRCRKCKSKNVRIVKAEKVDEPTLQDRWIEASRVVQYHCLCGHEWQGNKTGRVKCPECKKINTMTKNVVRVSDIVGMAEVKIKRNHRDFKSALREILKYCFKPVSTPDCEFLVDVMRLFQKRRLLMTKGDLYNNERFNTIKLLKKMDREAEFENYMYWDSFSVKVFAALFPAHFVVKIYDFCLSKYEQMNMLRNAILDYIKKKGFRPPPAPVVSGEMNKSREVLSECLSRLLAVCSSRALQRQGYVF